MTQAGAILSVVVLLLGTATPALSQAPAQSSETTEQTLIAPSFAPRTLGNPPRARSTNLPRARWENLARGDIWTRVSMSAVKSHGRILTETVPKDIANWCPAYPDADLDDRAAFWTALISTLARYESTWNPRAVGGGGLWFGLMQIYPQTAEFRRCRVQTGEGLKHGPSNLNCAIRIMSITVPRDNAIAVKDTRWRGVAADWGPIRTDWMRRDMQAYTRRQPYCRPLSAVRPKARPQMAQPAPMLSVPSLDGASN